MSTGLKRILLATIVLAIGLPVLVIAQEEKPPVTQDADAEAARLKERVKDLGSKSFEVREGAMESLRKTGEKAIPFLEEGAKSEDAEVRWRSRALLREIRRGKAEEGEGREGEGWSEDDDDFPFGPRPPFPPGGFRLFPDEEELEEWFGREFDRFPEDLIKHLEEMQRRIFRGGVNPWNDPLRERGVRGRSSGIRIEQGPDGRMRVETLRNGKWVPMTGSEESPDGGIRIERGPDGRTRVETFRDGRWVPMDGSRETPDPVYGLSLKAPTDALRAQLSLEEGTGLVVTQLDEEGSAASAGLRRYDVISAVNGEKVGTPEAFAEKVDATPEGQAATLEVIRKAKPIEVSLPVQRTRKF